LARRIPFEVISADSRQVYRGLTVGTAKPNGIWVHQPACPENQGAALPSHPETPESAPGPCAYHVDGIPHHLMDSLDPRETYSAGLFARQAERVLAASAKQERPCLVVGGTGLYLRALVDGIASLPAQDPVLRRTLSARAADEGRPALHRDLAKVDPDSAARIPANNIARVIRALEVFHLTGRPLSRWQTESTRPSSRAFCWYGLRWPKSDLEERLAARCRDMLPGLLDETAQLLQAGVPPEAPGLQALGYRLAVDRLQGRLSREDMETRFIHQTRLYAKRQMTWFRANTRISWVDVIEPFDPLDLAHRLRSQWTLA
jgi:tRNA dimethylallyltransferase